MALGVDPDTGQIDSPTSRGGDVRGGDNDRYSDVPYSITPEEEPFEWSWGAMLTGILPGALINIGRLIYHKIKENRGMTKSEALAEVKAENPEYANINDEDIVGGDGGDDWSPAIQDAINNSNAPSDVKEGLLSGKRIRKEAQNQLWNEMQNPSEYDAVIQSMGLKSADTWNTLMGQMQSGEFELPAWMQNISDKNFGRFTEASSRKGQLPGSTAYGQGTAAFNLSDQQSANAYGMGMLGMSYEQALGPYNSMNANRTNQYSTLFGGGGGLLDPQKPKGPDEPEWWETALDIGGDALTGYAYGKAGGMW